MSRKMRMPVMMRVLRSQGGIRYTSSITLRIHLLAILFHTMISLRKYGMMNYMRTSFTPLGNILMSALLCVIIGIPLAFYLVNYKKTDSGPTRTSSFSLTPAKPVAKTVSLGFVGDIIVHTPMARAARNSDGLYDFTTMFSRIKTYTEAPDIMIGNLETPVTGDGTLSGYPNFDAPVELIDALGAIGFDSLQITNNHSLDQGTKGLETTIQNVQSRGLTPIGGSLFESMAYTPVIQSKNGISVAFIAATFGFNGYQLPADKSHLANLIDVEKLTESIKSARSQGAEVVIVMPHFGIEYERTPNEDQKKLVDALVLAGADVIIGTHPHVVQPVEERVGADGKKVIIAYSLGNFISNQQDKYTDLELMINLTYERDPTTNRVSLKEYKKIPLYVHKYKTDGKNFFEVVPLTEALASAKLTPEDIARIQDYNNIMNTQFEPATKVPTPPDAQTVETIKAL